MHLPISHTTRCRLPQYGVRLLAVALSLVGGLSAAVTFHEKIPASTDWPDGVVIKTDAPTVGKSSVVSDAQSLVSQSITPLADLYLSDLWFPYMLREACPAGSVKIRVQQIPGGQPMEYAVASTTLLDVHNSTELGATGDGETVLMQVSFDGPDRIELQAGKTYAIEVGSTDTPLMFFRRGADYYPHGTAYVNRKALQFGEGRFRDIIMAVGGGEGAVPQVSDASATVSDEPALEMLDRPIWPTKRWTEVGEEAGKSASVD